MRVEKPIIIVGVGRSGSTIFQRMLSEHPKVAWLSSEVGDRFPGSPNLNGLLMKIIDFPIIGRLLRRICSPGEPYNFWEYYCKGFSKPCRDLLAEDVTIQVKRKLPRALATTLTQKRNRLLIKITGWSRIGFLNEIFYDAKFIHMTRDRKAVINSLINVDWWTGWKGPNNLRCGELTSAQKIEWQGFNRSFIALAGIELKILIESMKKAEQLVLDDNFMEVQYEDLCADPLSVFKRVTEFCELQWIAEFEKQIKKHRLKSANDKWRHELTEEQQQIAKYFSGGD